MAQSPSDTQRWLKISAHLDRALDLSQVERDAWLKELAATDPESAAELVALLADHRQRPLRGAPPDHQSRSDQNEDLQPHTSLQTRPRC